MTFRLLVQTLRKNCFLILSYYILILKTKPGLLIIIIIIIIINPLNAKDVYIRPEI